MNPRILVSRIVWSPKRDTIMPHRGTFIAIAGPIGVGKTTLAQLLAKQLNAQLVPERFMSNPYLSRFYEPGGRERYAFHTEIAFLWQRYDQMREIEQMLSGGQTVITDWGAHFQSLVFSRLTLNEEDFQTYSACFERMMRDAPIPNHIVLLDADLDVLLERIQGRGRDMERHISREYLAALKSAYAKWQKETPVPLIRIDTTSLPIPHSEAAQVQVMQSIQEAIKRREKFNPAFSLHATGHDIKLGIR